MISLHIILSSLVIFFALIVNGCQGGGSSIPQSSFRVTVIVDPSIRDAIYTVTNYDTGKEIDSGLLMSTSYIATVPDDGEIYVFCVAGSNGETVYYDDAKRSYQPYLDSDELCTVVDSSTLDNADTTISTSYLTHVAFGLFRYLVKGNIGSTIAVNEANERISSMFPDANIAVDLPTKWRRFVKADLYVFLGGMTLYAHYLDSLDTAEPYSPQKFANELADDLAHDGLLNQLTCSTCTLRDSITPESFRNEIAKNIFTYRTDSLMPIADAIVLAESVNNADDAMFSGKAPVSLLAIEPIISNVSVSANDLLTATFVFKSYITDISGIDSVTYFIDETELIVRRIGSNRYEAKINSRSYPDGKHTITVVAKNILSSITELVVPFEIANERTIIDLSQNDGGYVNGQYYRFAASVYDATLGISSVEFLVNNRVSPTRSELSLSNPVALVDTTKYADGVINFGFKARNTVGFEITVGINVTIDNTPPDTPMIDVADGDVVTNVSTFVYSGKDNSKLNRVSLALNGVNIGSVINTFEPPSGSDISGIVDFDTSLLPDAWYPLSVTAQDAAGNITIDASRTIAIDNNPPELIILSPITDFVATGTFRVKTDSSDTIGVDIVRIRMHDVTSGAELEISRMGGGIDFRDFTTGSFTSGEKILKALSYDKVGNVTEKQIRFFIQN